MLSSKARFVREADAGSTSCEAHEAVLAWIKTSLT